MLDACAWPFSTRLSASCNNSFTFSLVSYNNSNNTVSAMFCERNWSTTEYYSGATRHCLDIISVHLFIRSCNFCLLKPLVLDYLTSWFCSGFPRVLSTYLFWYQSCSYPNSGFRSKLLRPKITSRCRFVCILNYSHPSLHTLCFLTHRNYLSVSRCLVLSVDESVTLRSTQIHHLLIPHSLFSDWAI